MHKAPGIKNPDRVTPVKSRNLKRTLLLTGISTIIILLVLYFMFPQNLSPLSHGANASSTTSSSNNTSGSLDISRLAGRWMRPDGGYILEIRSAAPDGKLEVGYYNPNPVNVGRAEWVEKDKKLYVLVELQDVNYPGSTYGLEYIVSQDRLAGTYYQALEKSTFDVEFVREK